MSSSTIPSADIVVVGGGIVGLATAMKLGQRYCDARVIVVETESGVGRHQSGHNSGVLHSGIYYQPKSQKALLCRAGKVAMERFCDQHEIAWDRCGKVVVATTADEIERLRSISDRGTQNGVQHEWIDTDQLRELEPSAAGLAALHVPETGIVDYGKVCQTMARVIGSRDQSEQGSSKQGSSKQGSSKQGSSQVRLDFDVCEINTIGDSIELRSRRGDRLRCNRLINCAGLQSDRVYAMAGGTRDVRIVPFRGEYYELTRDAESLCRHLIYPVPDPSFPFLGVHFTRMIGGGVECGPNAVLALSRQGYRWRDIKAGDLIDAVGFGGFRRLAMNHWRMGLGEIHRSASKRAFVTALQKLVPAIRPQNLKPGRAGVRAQAVAPDGTLVDDFLIRSTRHAIHVLNAPSPAATASIAIADHIVDVFAKMPAES